MISFTCESNIGPTAGDNFYLAEYGILVEQASDSCVAWQPKHAHGTTLPTPVPGRLNSGVSFDLPNKSKHAKMNLDKKLAGEMEMDF
jgi:hypothetical protein